MKEHRHESCYRRYQRGQDRCQICHHAHSGAESRACDVSGPHVCITKEGAVLTAVVIGNLTESGLARLRRDMNQAIHEQRPGAWLIDLCRCTIDFPLAHLQDGFIDGERARVENRPGAFLVANHQRSAFNEVSWSAAKRGVIMPPFESQCAALRFIERQAVLWWTGRPYPGPAPTLRMDPVAVSRCRQDRAFQAQLANLARPDPRLLEGGVQGEQR